MNLTGREAIGTVTLRGNCSGSETILRGWGRQAIRTSVSTKGINFFGKPFGEFREGLVAAQDQASACDRAAFFVQ